MDGPRDDHTKWRKSAPLPQNQMVCDVTYVWNFEKRCKWAFLQNKQTQS